MAGWWFFFGGLRAVVPGPSPGFPVSAVLTRAQVERFPGSWFRCHVPISGPWWPSKASWRIVRPRVRGRVPEDLIDPVSKILGALRPSAHVCGKAPKGLRGRESKTARAVRARGVGPGGWCVGLSNVPRLAYWHIRMAYSPTGPRGGVRACGRVCVGVGVRSEFGPSVPRALHQKTAPKKLNFALDRITHGMAQG